MIRQNHIFESKSNVKFIGAAGATGIVDSLCISIIGHTGKSNAAGADMVDQDAHPIG